MFVIGPDHAVEIVASEQRPQDVVIYAASAADIEGFLYRQYRQVRVDDSGAVGSRRRYRAVLSRVHALVVMHRVFDERLLGMQYEDTVLHASKSRRAAELAETVVDVAGAIDDYAEQER